MRIAMMITASLAACIAAPVSACPFHGGGPGRFSAFGGQGNMPSPQFEDPWSSTPTNATQVLTLIPQEPQTSLVPTAPTDNATRVKLSGQSTQNEKAKSVTASKPARLSPNKN